MSFCISNRFRFFVLWLQLLKIPIHKDIVADRIKASTARFTRRGNASLKEHLNSPRLFELNSRCSKVIVLRSVSSSLARSTSSIQFISERRGLRIQDSTLMP
jgi:hypothetical protein